MKSSWICIIILGFNLLGCASDNTAERRDRTNPAAYDANAFLVPHEMPSRQPSGDQEFFFKRCELNSRKVYTDKIEYSCN